MNKEIELLKEASDEEKINVLIEIKSKKLYDDSVIEEILSLFKTTENELVRERIEDILSEVDSDKVIKELISCFSHYEAIVRNTAIKILQKKGEKVLPYLKEVYPKSDKDVRKLILDTASEIIENREAVLELISYGLSDEDINVRISAVEYVGKLELFELSDVVFKIFKEADEPFLKITALETLSIVDRGKHLKEIIEYMNALEDEKELLIFPFIKYIGGNGGKEELFIISELFETYSEIYLKELTNAVEHIVEREGIKRLPDTVFDKLFELAFSNINPINRYGLVTFLGNFENEKVYELIKKALASDEKMLVLGALEIVAERGLEKDFSDEILKLKERFKEDEEISSILEEILYFLEE